MILTKPKKLISLPKLLAKAQRIFNAWIRNRDKDACCITCGRYQIEHACHFYPAGTYPALRFNEDNCHGGCLQDNYFKHGDLSNYRRHLEKRIGPDRLALLDSIATRNRFKKWTRFELEIIIEQYSLKNKVREAKHLGTGIYVHSQFSPKCLIKGDTFYDADFGNVEWDGNEWQQIQAK